jgi:hypothetical protein
MEYNRSRAREVTVGKETWNPTINILDQSQIYIDWPHEVVFSDLGSINHPNTQVLVNRGKKECVAVYGESFSWGDSMDSPFVEQQIGLKGSTLDKENFKHQFFNENGNFLVRRDNFTFRMNNNFGGQLTRMMDTDYYFSCVPGQGTTTTLYGLQNSIERLSSSYDKVYIIFQLTCPARDFDITDKDPILYTESKEKHQMKINMLIKRANKLDTGNFFKLYEQIYANRLKELSEKYPNCQFVVWRNFTSWCGARFESVIQIEDPMIEHYAMLTNVEGCNITAPVMRASWDQFVNKIKTNTNKKYVIDQINLEEESYNFMKNRDNIYEGDRWGGTGSYHPSPIGHKVWAEYILQHIEEHNGKD